MIENFFKQVKVDNSFFIKAADQIVAWNAKARGGVTPEFTQEMFEAQLSFVREELKEFQAAAQENDHVELLDAAADIFVVASYLAFMFFGKEGVDKALEMPTGDVLAENIYDVIIEFDKMVENDLQFALMSLTLTRMARDTLVRSVYNEKKVMREVLNSNESKYPTKKQLLVIWETKDIIEALEKECDAIEMRSKDRAEGSYTGVHAVYNEVQKVYVFFDDKGKIMKPSTFVKPNIAAIIA